MLQINVQQITLVFPACKLSPLEKMQKKWQKAQLTYRKTEIGKKVDVQCKQSPNSRQTARDPHKFVFDNSYTRGHVLPQIPVALPDLTAIHHNSYGRTPMTPLLEVKTLLTDSHHYFTRQMPQCCD